MKNFTKKLFMMSVISIVLGAVLLGAGYSTGGLQAIKQRSEPKLVTKTFNQVTDLELDANYAEFEIKTGNVDKPTLTYYTHPKFISPISGNLKDGKLTISQKDRDVIITGGIEILGYGLNELGREKNFRLITLTFPNDTSLNTLTGSSMPSVSVDGINFNEVDYNGQLTLLNSSVNKGQVDGSFNGIKTKLTDFTIKSDYAFVNLTDTSLEKGEISLANGGLTTDNSNLKSVSVSASEYGGIELNRGSIENFSFTSDNEKDDEDDYYYNVVGEVTINNVTLKGDNTIKGGNLNVDALLTDIKPIAYDLSTVKGNITLGSNFTDVKLDRDSSTGATTFKSQPSEQTGTLNISITKGDIKLQ
ncbi:Putative adhesin [Streptococcus henryi]|uniref:Putative adhesin n=1 Tax=Streptococcus henryi TaxID=439219 RepID=A0A1G5ZZW5_9STRE|nr:DUF4097 family beta strand repeat-containing protein [Streptococcus henryi]SDB01685.1 Putative adhesin [Streptococcus henryi]